MSEANGSRASISIAVTAWLAVIAASILGFQIVVSVTGYADRDLDDVPFWLYPISAMLVLWIPTLVVLWWVSRRYLSGRPLRDYRVSFAPLDLVGVPVGVASQILLVQVLYWPLGKWFPDTFGRDEVEEPALRLAERATGGWAIALVLAVVVGAPVMEELLYRGLALRSLSARLGMRLAVAVGAAWFAVAHLQAVQFLGLFVFGLVLGVCAERTGRLGMAMLAHAAFNATSLVILWPKR